MVIALLVVCLQVNAHVSAQSVTFSRKNVALETVFEAIHAQTGYFFWYNSDLLKKARRVDLEVYRMPVRELMDLCLKDQPLTYTITGKTIVIKRREKDPAPAAALEQPPAAVIKGRVTDAAGLPLPGVTVQVKGTGNGTVTNEHGAFELAGVETGAILVFSYVGYQRKEVVISGQEALQVTLAPAAADLESIVVIGYGTARKKDLTGAVSQIKTADITARPTTNVMQALQGRAPGVQVQQNNGAPGGSISVRIRGTNSILGSNEPLYVVDGYPYSGNPTFLQNADIASIEILKDASSTAIYGSRGANGVVMITTRSGSRKRKTTVDFEAGYTLQSPSRKLKMMNALQYAELYNEQAANDNLSPRFTQQELDEFAKSPGTDWQELVTRTAPMFVSNLNVSGGNEKTQFSLSAGAFLQEGIIRNTDYNRYTIRANINHEISRIFSVSYNATLVKHNSLQQNQEKGNRGNNVFSGMIMAPPTLTPYNEDGSYRRLNTAYPFIASSLINPLVRVNEVTDRMKADRVISNAAVTIKPLEDLSIRISGGIENSNNRSDFYANIEPTTNSVGNAEVNTEQLTGLLNENIANYTKRIGRHRINAMAGFTYQQHVVTNLAGSGRGFLSDVTKTGDLAGAASPGVPGSGYSKWALVSYLGRLNYTYNDKYLFTVSYRRDGSSRYSPENRWSSFPSAALAWRISSEPFLAGLDFISDLKLRTSYGATGSTAIDPYQTLNQLESGYTVFANDVYTFYAPGNTLPGNLKWETTRQFDVGLDAALLNDRIRLTLDYYHKRTKDLLNNVQLPASIGYTTTVQNVGEIENKGVEASVEADILEGRALRWNLAANISFNRNKVLKLYGGQDIFGSTIYTGSLNDYVNLLREGQPMGIFYGYVESGYTENGDLQYEDRNKDGSISPADKTYIGNPNPDFIYGLNSTLSWKGLELTVFIQGSQGNDIFNLNRAMTIDFTPALNQLEEVYLDHWTPDNRDAKYPRISRSLNGNMSTRLVEDGSYIRLRNIQLAYNLPVGKISWLRKAQVYISGQNLLTITRYSWYDPEINAYGGSNSINQGIDYYTYPASKSVSFGIRCGF